MGAWAQLILSEAVLGESSPRNLPEGSHAGAACDSSGAGELFIQTRKQEATEAVRFP